MPEPLLGYQHLEQILKDLRSHIPGDPSWQASAGALLRAIVHAMMRDHPDNPANQPESEKTPEQKRAEELKALHEKHAQERADEAAAEADRVKQDEEREQPDTDHTIAERERARDVERRQVQGLAPRPAVSSGTSPY